MINEKQLIEDLKNTFSDSVLNQTFGFGKYSLLEALEEMINRQPQVATDTNVGSKCSDCSRRKFYQQGYQDGLNADKWILCEVEMPKEEMEVWVTHENGKVLRHYWFNGEFVQNYPLDEPRPYPKAIAWMPCIKPQPYKKEGNSNENT